MSVNKETSLGSSLSFPMKLMVLVGYFTYMEHVLDVDVLVCCFGFFPYDYQRKMINESLFWPCPWRGLSIFQGCIW